MALSGKETYQLTHLSKKEFIAELYNRYGKKLYAYAVRSWKLGEDDAWDMVYKTLYKVIDSYRQYTFESEEKFGAFVFRIFVNYLRNLYRDNKRVAEEFRLVDVDDQSLANMPDPSGNKSPDHPALKALNDVLQELEEWQKILLLMRSEGRPYSEIAKYVDRPEEQLKVYYQRLKEQISKKLHERA